MGTETKLESSTGRRETSSKRGKSCSWFQGRENARRPLLIIVILIFSLTSSCGQTQNMRNTRNKATIESLYAKVVYLMNSLRLSNLWEKGSSDLVYWRVRLPNSPRSHAVCTWCSRGRGMDDRPGTVPEKREPRSKSTWSLFLAL